MKRYIQKRHCKEIQLQRDPPKSDQMTNAKVTWRKKLLQRDLLRESRDFFHWITQGGPENPSVNLVSKL